MTRPTALIYSSHNRCEYLHRQFIIERALESQDNKTILFLPMSMDERHQQDYGWGTFRWYLQRFEQYGLRSMPFFWDDNLRREDADILFHHLYHDQVVILGGGNSELGMWRFRELGRRFYGDAELFGRVLHERQERNLLTAGFSAGADQLGELLVSVVDGELEDPRGFALARNLMCTLHHESSRMDDLQHCAQRIPQCMVFGLPNDSGLLISQGQLPSGNLWQLVQFIIDKSWDDPKDGWHIKTRMDQKIDHVYPDGRNWSFGGGERMLRVISPDGNWQDAWMEVHHSPLLHYGTQLPTFHRSFDDVLSTH